MSRAVQAVQAVHVRTVNSSEDATETTTTGLKRCRVLKETVICEEGSRQALHAVLALLQDVLQDPLKDGFQARPMYVEIYLHVFEPTRKGTSA